MKVNKYELRNIEESKKLEEILTRYELLARALKNNVVQVRYLSNESPEEIQHWCDIILLDLADKKYLLEYTENKIERIKKEFEKL